MNIALLPVDSTYPNLAMMKLSAWHKKRGDTVEWYNGIDHYDKVYMAKVFTFTPDYGYYINADEMEKGGTGYDLHKTLPKEIDRLQPDYYIYPQIDSKTAYGFLTRGCPNRCKWCVVPKKEGNITSYMDVDEIAVEGRTNLILMASNGLLLGELKQLHNRFTTAADRYFNEFASMVNTEKQKMDMFTDIDEFDELLRKWSKLPKEWKSKEEK